MSLIKVKCFSCGTELNFAQYITRRDECDTCRSDVRCCRNCRFYDPKVYNECKETSADVVRVKDRSNMCDYFHPNTAVAESETRENLLAAAEALFKKN